MKKRTGNVYWANSQKIDKFDKKDRRQYAVVKDNGKNVGVSKVRGFNDNAKNNQRLFELDCKKYPLSKRSGVDNKVYTKGANKKHLRLEDRDIFDSSPAFKLSSSDTHKVLQHVILRTGKQHKKRSKF